MSFLTPRQSHTLSRVCDTFIPALDAQGEEDERLFSIRATDLGLAELVEEKLVAVTTGGKQRQLKIFLDLLEFPLLNFIISGNWGRFSHMELARRTAVLRAWGNSRLARNRQAFQSLKRLTLFMFYACMPDEKPNPTWPVFAYDGPPAPITATPAIIEPYRFDPAQVLETEVLVIGSGAGGGVVAGELSAAGLDITVVEKGKYIADEDYTGRELEGYENLYEKGGALTTEDVSMNVLAGSTLGGGTTVNWMTSLRPPEFVLAEWADEFGFTAVTGAAFQAGLESVITRLHINTDESFTNRQNALLAQGAQQRRCRLEVIPRNVKDCVDCTYCNFGCMYGAKQSTAKTYLQDAFRQGARILVQAHVDRLLIEAGKVTGAECTVWQDGQMHPLTIKAEIVVAAAGAIHTPALLLRSGLTNQHIGKNLHMHPVSQTWGIYDEPVFSWQGAPQSRVVYEYDNLNGRGYGVWVETSPGHPGTYASALPWQSGRQHKELMQQLQYIANHIILTRDCHSGQIQLDEEGQPRILYQLHKDDAAHLWRGLEESFKIHRASGARLLIAPHNRYVVFAPGDNFETFLARVKKMGFPSNGFGLFSAHQMSSCRIAADPALGAVQPHGETFEVQNLYVADASVFPTAVGVNPMLPIMGTAHYIAQQIKDRAG